MQYWWVNQKQTYRHEISGGYLWSPKKNKNGLPYWPYDFMRSICPGDIVFSYAGGYIKAIGIAGSYCYEFPKPTEFVNPSNNWNENGWRVDILYKEMPYPIRPSEHLELLRPLLPNKYSPLKPNGHGNQAYLFNISKDLALVIAQLSDSSILELVRGNESHELPIIESSATNINEWEDRIEKSIEANTAIPETERSTIIKSRRGQGQFRTNLLNIESRCRVTGVNKPSHLIASHTKPWRDSDNEERLDPENGFMLTPTIDHLFDRGFISFENNGVLVVSKVAHAKSLQKMGVISDGSVNVGKFTEGQKHYLDWHRDNILL